MQNSDNPNNKFCTYELTLSQVKKLNQPKGSVQFSLSVVSNSLQLHEPQHARPPCPSPTPRVYPNSRPLGRWCHPTISSSVVLLSSCPQSFPASGYFQKSALHIRWPKNWSFSFSINPSNEHPGQISLRMDWLDVLAVQGTLKSLLQHYNSKASLLWYSAFFIVQLSHPYMTTVKTIALTRRTFVDKVMSLLFNMLSRIVITFFPRSKCLLISWLQSPSNIFLPDIHFKIIFISIIQMINGKVKFFRRVRNYKTIVKQKFQN